MFDCDPNREENKKKIEFKQIGKKTDTNIKKEEMRVVQHGITKGNLKTLSK